MKLKSIKGLLDVECPYEISKDEKFLCGNTERDIANRKQGYWNACYDLSNNQLIGKEIGEKDLPKMDREALADVIYKAMGGVASELNWHGCLLLADAIIANQDELFECK